MFPYFCYQTYVFQCITLVFKCIIFSCVIQCIGVSQLHNVTIWQCIDNKFCWFCLGFIKMSNIESINISIKIHGKAIDVTYKTWTKSTNWYKSAMIINKNYSMLLKTTLNVTTSCVILHQNSIQSSSSYPRWNEALDEQGNKLVLKPCPMFEFGKGKKTCRL